MAMRGSTRGIELIWRRKSSAPVYEVSNVLGVGFPRSGLRTIACGKKNSHFRGIKARRQAPVRVNYKGDPVGKYRADILVVGKLLVEVKCADEFANEHLAQCLNYLKATDRTLCLLVNFQKPKVEWKRIVYNF